MPRGRRAALLLAAASPARALIAPHTISARDIRRNLATTPDEISHAAHYHAYDYNAQTRESRWATPEGDEPPPPPRNPFAY